MDSSSRRRILKMNEQAITSRFRAHLAAGKTAAENKRLIVPHILAARSSRTKGDLPMALIQEGFGSHWNETIWKNNSGDLLFRDIEDHCTGQWAFHLYSNKPSLDKRPGKLTLQNCYMGPQLEPFYDGMMWGERSGNSPQREYIDCDWFGIGDHAVYIDVYEGTIFDRCTFIRIGSQAIQVAHRELPFSQYGPSARPYEAKPLHTVRDTHIVDAGDGGGRASYNITFFNPGNPEHPATIKIENCSLVNEHTEERGYFKTRSTGGLLVSPDQGNRPLTGNFAELVHVKNTLFDFTQPDRSLVKIRCTDEIILEDCTFITRGKSWGPAVSIDSPNGYTADCKAKRVILRNCIAKGNTQLKLTVGEDEVTHDLNTLGKEVIIDGATGVVISEREIGPASEADKKRLAASLAKDRREYYAS